VQSWPYESQSQSLRPSPSSRIAVTSCNEWLHQLILSYIDKNMIIHQKIQAKFYTKICILSFCHIPSSGRKDSIMMLAITQFLETNNQNWLQQVGDVLTRWCEYKEFHKAVIFEFGNSENVTVLFRFRVSQLGHIQGGGLCDHRIKQWRRHPLNCWFA
jgi:hypothetical protein